MSIEFDIEGMDNGLNVEKFRADWIDFTIDENLAIVGSKELSDIQLLMINAFCGDDSNPRYEEWGMTLTNIGPPQAEAEALFRGRARALAAVFQEHMQRSHE